MTTSRILIDDTAVHREVQVSSGQVSTDTRSTESFLGALAKRVPLESGLLPPGLLSVRQAGPHSQIVLQSPPDVNRVLWGRYEGDADAGHYLVAQPWRIQICDMAEEDMLGCRMFYSPVQVSHADQPLYLANVPNINTRGYGGVGLGWLCLYPMESWKGWTFAQKIARILERCSGAEAYNDANMSETDGPRFYQAERKPNYTWNPHEWEKKTKKHGVDWVLDSGLWIPALVGGIDDQDHYVPGGEPLTLGMAMYGNASAYYSDRAVKMQNRLVRGEAIATPELAKEFNAAFVRAKPLGEQQPTPNPEPAVNPNVLLGGPVFVAHQELDEDEWDVALIGVHGDGDFDWYCPNPDCGAGHYGDDEICEDCASACRVCSEATLKIFGYDQIHHVPVKDDFIVLCDECFEKSRICNNCSNLVQEYYTTQEQTFLCFGCVSWCAGCNRPFQGTASVGVCPQCGAAGYTAILTA